jgi:DUF2945 family protein
VPTENVAYQGHTYHATPNEPQYEVAGDKTEHIATHNGEALRKLRD